MGFNCNLSRLFHRVPFCIILLSGECMIASLIYNQIYMVSSVMTESNFGHTIGTLDL